MMKYKLYFLVSVMLLLGYAAQSQSDGISFGLRGGFDLQTFNGKDNNGDPLKLDMVPRFNVGVVVDIPVAPEIYFQTGLLYTTKGAKSDNQFLGLDMSAEYNLAYIELPLNVVYKGTLGSGRVILGFGPYIAYGVGGNVKYVVGNVETEEKIEYTKEYNDLTSLDWKYFKPFDYGGNLFFGYELQNGILVQINTQLGMAKINSTNNTNVNNETIFKNTGFGITVGYNF